MIETILIGTGLYAWTGLMTWRHFWVMEHRMVTSGIVARDTTHEREGTVRIAKLLSMIWPLYWLLHMWVWVKVRVTPND